MISKHNKQPVIPEILHGEEVVSVSELPSSWQEIYSGSAAVAYSNPERLVEMAQRFLWDMSHNPHLVDGEALARQTLEFYATDFDPQAYPDLDFVRENLVEGRPDTELRRRLVDFYESFRGEFGYELPASAHGVMLAPLVREDVREMRPLRYSEPDKPFAQGWDAALHGIGLTYPVHLKMQSLASQHGFVWAHGCGCNHKINDIDTVAPFDYDIDPNKRDMWMQDTLWNILGQHAAFDITPTSRALVESVVVPEIELKPELVKIGSRALFGASA